MTTPTVHALELAAEWCDQYEGEPDDMSELEAMKSVVAWLREKADAKLKREANTIAIKRYAAERGVTASQVRNALKRSRTQRG